MKVVNLITMDFKTVSGFRSVKPNCRKLLKQSIICRACFLSQVESKIMKKPTKIHRTTELQNYRTT